VTLSSGLRHVDLTLECEFCGHLIVKKGVWFMTASTFKVPRMQSSGSPSCPPPPVTWEFIDARIVECDDREARLMEIAENLHRAELTDWSPSDSEIVTHRKHSALRLRCHREH
jgi:hypothetical protein